MTQENKWNKLVSQKKTWGKTFPKKQFTIVKRSFWSSTKLLSLDFTIPVDELTTETFYHFRTFELFNIWTPSFFFVARILVRD